MVSVYLTLLTDQYLTLLNDWGIPIFSIYILFPIHDLVLASHDSGVTGTVFRTGTTP